MKKILAYCVALLVMAVSCKKNDQAVQSLPALELKDVSYGADARNRMDIYLPAGRTSSHTKALILIHGGAWVSGDKSEMNEAVASFRNLLPDYAIFNMNYRLATMSSNLWPAQIDDVNAAVNFILNRSGEYRFNRNLVAIGGASAGAHLALLHAYRFNNGSIKAVADLFGPTEMKALYQASPANTQFLLNVFMGGTPASNAAAYNNASPLYFVSPNSVPTIILHGTADNVVPISQSDSLNNRLAAAGVPRRYEVYNGEGHGVWSAANTNDAFSKTAAFLTLHVK